MLIALCVVIAAKTGRLYYVVWSPMVATLLWNPDRKLGWLQISLGCCGPRCNTTRAATLLPQCGNSRPPQVVSRTPGADRVVKCVFNGWWWGRNCLVGFAIACRGRFPSSFPTLAKWLYGTFISLENLSLETRLLEITSVNDTFWKYQAFAPDSSTVLVLLLVKVLFQTKIGNWSKISRFYL